MIESTSYNETTRITGVISTFLDVKKAQLHVAVDDKVDTLPCRFIWLSNFGLHRANSVLTFSAASN